MHVITYDPLADTLTFLVNQQQRQTVPGPLYRGDAILYSGTNPMLPVGVELKTFSEALTRYGGRMRKDADGKARLLDVLGYLQHEATGGGGKGFSDRDLVNQRFFTAAALIQDATFSPADILAAHNSPQA